MSWLLPSALAIAGVALVATIALHFIARSRPLAEPLPTARFIPQRPVRARTRSFSFSDLLLLLVRAAAIAAVGLAVAGPLFAVAHGRIARVVVVDRSRSVANIAELRDSVRSIARPGDAIVAFDSAATVAAVASIDSVAPSATRGSLSAGLALALRAAAPLARSADSVELVIVSAFSAEELDDATTRIRAAWPGRARLVHVAASPATAWDRAIETTADANDVVVAGLSLATSIRNAATIRLVRGRVSRADSAWAGDSGHVLIHWPDADSSARWPARATIDAIGAVASPTGTVVARFPRLWNVDGRAIARWSDGEPAAVERPFGTGCIRDVAILFDPASDVTLRLPFRAFVRALLEPCGGARSPATIESATMTALAGPSLLASAAALTDRDGSRDVSTWTPWLLALAAALLLVELAVRRTQKAAA